MRRTQLGFISGLSALVFASTLVAGCGDDDGGEDPQGEGGSGGASGGVVNGGRAGMAGRAGSTQAGGSSGGGAVAGNSGVAGASDAGAGGEPSGAGSGGAPSAGTGPGGEGGLGGSGGSGGDAVAFAPITKVSTTTVPDVHDLRGLTYSADGTLLYASGHVGLDAKTADRSIAVVRFDADGEVDTNFGEEGIATFNIVPRVEVAGVVTNDGNEESLGIVELESGELLLQANLRDVNGKGTDVALVKLDASGDLVEAFGDSGVVRLNFGWAPTDDVAWPAGLPVGSATAPADQGWGLALDTSTNVEKVVVCGHGPARRDATAATQRVDNDRYVARVLTTSGASDPSFNAGQPFTLNTGGTFADNGRRCSVEEDGAILSTGYTNFGEGLGNHIVLIRLTPDGKADASFRFGGALAGVGRANPFLDDGGMAEAYAAAKQSNGRYVTTGYGRATAAGLPSTYGWQTTDGVDLVAFGVRPDGIDTDWGVRGTLAVQSEELGLVSSEDRGRDVLALPDDRIVHAGRFGVSPALIVTSPEGALDPDNGVGYRFLYDALTPEPTSHFYRLVLAPNGKRVAASTSNHAAGAVVAILEVGE